MESLTLTSGHPGKDRQVTRPGRAAETVRRWRRHAEKCGPWMESVTPLVSPSAWVLYKFPLDDQDSVEILQAATAGNTLSKNLPTLLGFVYT